MEILNLHLANFRNFSSKKIVFDKGLTVLIGPNGSGKSNILEAIGLFSGIRPVKIDTDFDLVKFGESEVKIEVKVFDWNQDKVLTINMIVSDERYVRKAYFIDSVKKRLADLSLSLSVVIFSPQDLELVTGSPSVRRHHLDDQLSSTDREYHRSINAYNKIITRRNKILQRVAEGKSRPGELDFWDERLLEHGRYISQKRMEFFEFLNSSASKHLGFTSEVKSRRYQESTLRVFPAGFSWALRQSLLSKEKLFQNRERDISAGITLSGPHRDDFRFLLKSRRPGASGPEGRDLEFFGSRGEQRLSVLTLKLAELEFNQVKLGSRPILALDDIFSELDWEHRETVLSIIGKQQTIITAAEEDSVPKQIFKRAKIVELT
ncbi:MAG: DNA replication and repair protein recF [uncultured bacterium]|nr:MAG: DNA replication and repair protein recF [uncultured bacterium]OGD91918.1 MAG: hypothetical protein A3E14_01505 [Candidatus Curtissbacteria bacterium RIFCSPHIGHO2_12_FULL_41_13]OGE10044.1 MAG: hypothetical protein A2470_00285 [Candidatus Curtissbacteria bacterium RIFOXYC2_FULL_41_11]OGE11772.1 MAG: hypothetical protein A3J89_03205 [Candidatus Curtissbacteria bacterium RIFOXYB12_FULL_40_6]OGE12279.1 MAG: hypothetical protein A2305_05635 [Candidatus Curtissbacteria bacterium RIFOXYB2_FULL_